MKQYKIKTDGTFAPVQKLIDLGGKNYLHFTGDSTMEYHYINKFGQITVGDNDNIPKHIEEIYLDDFPRKMLTSNNGRTWVERIVIYKHKDLYICVSTSDEENYNKGLFYDILSYKFAKKLDNIKEVTMKDIEDKFGCKIKIINTNSND